MENEFKLALQKIHQRRMDNGRMQPRIKMMDELSDSDNDGPELFTANPSDDIPRNKLVE